MNKTTPEPVDDMDATFEALKRTPFETVALWLGSRAGMDTYAQFIDIAVEYRGFCDVGWPHECLLDDTGWTKQAFNDEIERRVVERVGKNNE